MIPFKKISTDQKEWLNEYLHRMDKQCCEYSFVNLYLWGRKRVAEMDGFLLIQAQFDRKIVYLYPVGEGDIKKVLDAIFHDAAVRGIPCCLAALTEADCRQVEQLYPGAFQIYCDRDSYDYLYAIDDLADLKGRKYQKKRNHANRFRAEHPNYSVVPLTPCNMPMAQHMINDWYVSRMREDPDGDYMLENIALAKACRCYDILGLDGILLMDGDQVLAVTMGSRLAEDTFDIHFEKARETVDGAYTVVNQEFARYLRLKYEGLAYLDREEDMGLEGLRKAKLSYNPHHMIDKHTAYVAEEIHDL